MLTLRSLIVKLNCQQLQFHSLVVLGFYIFMCLAVARSEVTGGHVLSRYFQVEKQFDAGQHVFAPTRKRHSKH